MKKNNIMVVTVPSAYVTKTKQRIKQYDNTVYLKNGDEFEIELFNPTQNKVLAKIEINNNTIGGSGIVLRPGERVFLERYINEAKKFLFETYKVSGNNSDVERAIKNNGDIVVKFYQEQIQPQINLGPFWPQYDNGIRYYSSSPNTLRYYSSPSTGDPHYGTITTSSLSGTLTNTSSANYFSTASLGEVTTDSVSFTTSSTPIVDSGDVLRSKKSLRKVTPEQTKEIETGRIEKGSNSSQSFTYDYSKFNSYHTWVSTWKILPESQKEVVIEDLSIFCTECGAKRKKDSHKFCPHCGTKF